MRRLLGLFLLLCLLLTLCACGRKAGSSKVPAGTAGGDHGGSDAPGDSSTPTEPPASGGSVSALEALPTLRGETAVSDGDYIYYTVDSDGDPGTIQPDIDGLYRADLSMQNPVRLARGYCHSLALDGDTLYFILEDIAGGHAICAVDRAGTGLRRIVGDAAGASDLFLSDGKLYYVQDYQLCTVEDLETGAVSRYSSGYQQILQAAPAADGQLWLGVMDPGDLSRMVHLYDPAAGTDWGVSFLGSSFVVAEDGTVYFYFDTPEQPDYEDYRQYNCALMALNEVYDPHTAGVEGRFADELHAYGPYLLYTKYTEVEEKAGQGPATVRKLYCYDTRTGTETALPREDFIGVDIALRGVTAGRLFFDTYTYYGDRPEDEDFAECRSCDLTRPDAPAEYASLDTLVQTAEDSLAVQADDAEVNARLAEQERQREEEERRRQEEMRIYGPGTSSLYLKAGTGSACFRLVRMDDTTEFMILLSPGESTTQTFPDGWYILKAAYGETWISDEEAFGPGGRYSTTNAFHFTGGTYEITTGTTGSFTGDSQAGFVGS